MHLPVCTHAYRGIIPVLKEIYVHVPTTVSRSNCNLNHYKANCGLHFKWVVVLSEKTCEVIHIFNRVQLEVFNLVMIKEITEA